MEMDGGGEGGWGGVVQEIQWAEIDRERKRRIVGGREIVRHSAGYIASRDNADSSSGSWQMFSVLAEGRLVPPQNETHKYGHIQLIKPRMLYLLSLP